MIAKQEAKYKQEIDKLRDQAHTSETSRQVQVAISVQQEKHMEKSMQMKEDYIQKVNKILAESHKTIDNEKEQAHIKELQ